MRFHLPNPLPPKAVWRGCGTAWKVSRRSCPGWSKGARIRLLGGLQSGNGPREDLVILNGQLPIPVALTYASRRNYAFYRQFLRATSHPANASIPSETLETLEAVHAEIGEKERAPRLAILELDQTLKQTNHSTTMSIEDWSGKAMEYWERWGSKGSVVTEMEGVVGEDEAKAEALVKILGNVTASHVSFRHESWLIYQETPDEYRRVVNKELLLLRTRAASWTADEAYLRSLSKLYNDGLRYGELLIIPS